jgi:RES domain-containing protein
LNTTYRGAYAGPAFRQCRMKYAAATTPVALIAGSLRDGGRFNPPGEFGALYASIDSATAIAELCRQIVRGAFSVRYYFPRVLLRFDVQLSQVYDLTHPPTMRATGLATRQILPYPDDPDDAGHAACQSVARTARARGFEAIRYPSATGTGENLAIFVDRLHLSSTVDLIQPWEPIASEMIGQILRINNAC